MAKKIDRARAKAAEERIATILREHPEVAERTARMLAHEPSTAALEGEMSEPETLEMPTVIKLPKSLLARADALKAKVAGNPEFQAIGRITRNAILRLAMVRGLEVLEEEYAADQADVDAARAALAEPERIPYEQARREVGL